MEKACAERMDLEEARIFGYLDFISGYFETKNKKKNISYFFFQRKEEEEEEEKYLMNLKKHHTPSI